MSEPGKEKDSCRKTYTVYLFGQGYWTGTDGKPVLSYPFTVHYAPDHPGGTFFLAEGDGRVGNGSFILPARLLEPVWQEHFRITGTLWLLPLLERLVHGEAIPPTEWLDAYQTVHGSAPPVEEWKAF